MTAQVLYRKWRPLRLGEVAGQPAITQTLRHALAQGRVAHAYLFTGPRGTGKTSTARILAKAVNCTNQQDGEPCNQCPACRDANEGQALDIVEMDAASHRGIDEIRGLRDRVHYSPTYGLYKTYVIDEVHMLTDAAFNALLKTLEEPPAHAIFVLATTDPQKVPATVISRCQRFDFHRISQTDAVERLVQICQDEGIQADQGALEAIARYAWGSLRDATNILEQAAVSFGTAITDDQVRDLLGIGDDAAALEVARYALEGDVRGGMVSLNQAASQGVDLRRFHRNIVDYLRAILLLKADPQTSLEHPSGTADRLRATAHDCSLARVYRVLSAFAQATVRQDSPSPLALELALVESTLAQEPASAEASAQVAPSHPPRRPAPARGAPAKQPSEGEGTTSKRARRQETHPDGAPASGDESVPSPQTTTGLAQGAVPDEQWSRLVASLKRKRGKRFSLDGLLNSARTHTIEGGQLVIGYPSRSNMERLQQELEHPNVRKTLADAVEHALGTRLDISPVLLTQDEGPQQRGHLVRAAQRMGGRVVAEEAITSEDES